MKKTAKPAFEPTAASALRLLAVPSSLRSSAAAQRGRLGRSFIARPHQGSLLMGTTKHNPASLYPKYLGYSHAVEVSGGSRTLFISGLNGYESDGKTMPESFEDQSEMIWSHIRSILASASMKIENLVLLRTYLANPEFRVADAQIRKKHLGEHEVALTVVSATLLHPSWKIEVEAVASA